MDRYIHPLTISDGKKASFQDPKILLKEEIKKVNVQDVCSLFMFYVIKLSVQQQFN